MALHESGSPSNSLFGKDVSGHVLNSGLDCWHLALATRRCDRSVGIDGYLPALSRGRHSLLETAAVVPKRCSFADEQRVQSVRLPCPHQPMNATACLPSMVRPFVSAAVLLALMFVLLAFHGSHAADRGSSRKLVRLTSTSGLNADPALSPDGTLLAYASDRADGEHFDIYVQPVAGGDAMRLTHDRAEETEPAFAPDGAHIVFSRRGAGLFSVGVFGGEPRLIAKAAWASTRRFSPNGK